MRSEWAFEKMVRRTPGDQIVEFGVAIRQEDLGGSRAMKRPKFEAKKIENGYIVWTWEDSDEYIGTKEFYCPSADEVVVTVAKLMDPMIASVDIKRHATFNDL